jgi:hypothetical protein
MTRKIKEGLMTGISPTQTGAMAGRFMKGLKRSVASGETDPSVLDKKRAQTQRIQRKVAARQALWKKDTTDPAEEYPRSMERFGKFYRRGQGTGSEYRPDLEVAPRGAPIPTHIQRAAKGLKPYRASTELVRGSRLALAERVINEVMGAPIQAGKLPRASKPGPNAKLVADEKASFEKFKKTRKYKTKPGQGSSKISGGDPGREYELYTDPFDKGTGNYWNRGKTSTGRVVSSDSNLGKDKLARDYTGDGYDAARDAIKKALRNRN